MKVNNKVLIYGLFIPLLFVLLEVCILGIEFNLIELVILIYITISTILIYGQNDDYLNPMVYFPILYFAYYWIGNFDMGYPKVPRSMWLLYGLGLLGFYFGGFLAKNVKVYNPKIMKKDYLSKGARYIFYAIYIVCIIAKVFIYCKNGIPIFSEKIDVIRQTASESFGAVKIIAGIHTILAVYFFYDIIITDQSKVFSTNKQVNFLLSGRDLLA